MLEPEPRSLVRVSLRSEGGTRVSEEWLPVPGLCNCARGVAIYGDGEIFSVDIKFLL